ncbi:MAG: cupredoxin domain-containing protein [Thaumarchaeota archaeon]|nr:cupredoxin domain-containing protein [Nitrososphaerota archaeon]
MLNENSGNSRFMVFAIVGCAALFVLIVVLVGEGFVRQVPIFWNEEIHATVAFEDVKGQTRVVGLVGNGGVDPTLVMKAGNTPYILTVINMDSRPHMFYVERLGVHTGILQPGQNETITLVSKDEGTFTYYDGLHPGRIIGEIISAKVEATD